ncbi:hypothetical protein [Sphingomonas sp. OTU376]|uniref:hypothetical protein n=1 Tax=Sphingomonas sp. OTU376 TaxID=3043863 RepID=UPI00313E570F
MIEQIGAGPASPAPDWEAIGLPAAIPPALEMIGRLGDSPDALVLWLDAVAPGASLRHLPSKMLLWTMHRLEESGFLSDELGKVAGLHARLIAGDEPPRAEWKAVRRAAIAETNARQGLDRLAHGVVEAAAWDPAVAPTVLREALGPWLQHIAATAATGTGWSEADVRAMQKIVDDARASDPAADPLTVVQEKAPALLARMDAARHADQAATVSAAAAALEALMRYTRECQQC